MDDGFAVAGNEDEVARLGVQTLGEGDELIDGEELGDGAANLARLGLDGQPGQRFGPLVAGQRLQLVQLLAAIRATAGGADGLDRFAGGHVLGKDAEGAVADDVGDVDQFQAVAQVGPVGAKALGGLGVAETREAPAGQRHEADRLDHANHEFLDQVQHVVALDEAHLHVQLGELRLAVGTQVFVAKAAGDLEVALVAGDHEQLLELLRALRQGVELAGVDAAGNQVVARAFGGALEQDGRLDFDEVTRAQEVANELHGVVAQHEVALHALAAQVEVAVAQAGGLVYRVVAVDQERGGLGDVQHHNPVGQHFDLAGRQIGVLLSGRAAADHAGDLDDVLATHGRRGGEAFGRASRIDDDLGLAAAVAQVDEDHAAHVAPPVDPAGQGDGLANVVAAQFAAAMRLQHTCLFR